ncbi:hypothetical protein CRU98_02820 [Arcobacter sp. CECT 8986]|uniref:protein kinase domain-containing protein n=1 Tax=Arcobacter sp. CECT 8986 TaxID=2044507 RepID=UPI001009A2EF|nr:protein kinase [Arcobacter sp. CECT 8986]RXK00102.1 hypothetical protein CRU98_02820 [Arcobacter sp. CECT 8986]
MNISKIVELFINVDRTISKSKLPNGFRQLKKEIFSDGKVVIKFTNYKRNKGIDDYAYLNEAIWLDRLQKFEFVPKFYGQEKRDNNIYLVMENIKGSSLENLSFKEWFFLKKNINIFENILKDILQAFKKEKLIHRDIRPHNIILFNQENKLKVKIIDFQYMISVYEDLNVPKKSLEHYQKVKENIGDIWRNKEIELNSFENDEFAVNKIVEDIKKENIIKFIIKKIKGYLK